MEALTDRLRWQWNWIAPRLGRLGWTGIVLCAAAIFVAAMVEIPDTFALRQLRATLSATPAASPTVQVASMDPSAALQSFYGFLPRPRMVPDIIENISKSARDHSVQMHEGEFRLVAEGHERLEQYMIILPCQARYTDLRAFLREIQIRYPQLALQEVGLRRDSAGTAQVEARLRFTLYLDGS